MLYNRGESQPLKIPASSTENHLPQKSFAISMGGFHIFKHSIFMKHVA